MVVFIHYTKNLKMYDFKRVNYFIIGTKNIFDLNLISELSLIKTRSNVTALGFPQRV